MVARPWPLIVKDILDAVPFPKRLVAGRDISLYPGEVLPGRVPGRDTVPFPNRNMLEAGVPNILLKVPEPGLGIGVVGEIILSEYRFIQIQRCCHTRLPAEHHFHVRMRLHLFRREETVVITQDRNRLVRVFFRHDLGDAVGKRQDLIRGVPQHGAALAFAPALFKSIISRYGIIGEPRFGVQLLNDLFRHF